MRGHFTKSGCDCAGALLVFYLNEWGGDINTLKEHLYFTGATGYTPSSFFSPSLFDGRTIDQLRDVVLQDIFLKNTIKGNY